MNQLGKICLKAKQVARDNNKKFQLRNGFTVKRGFCHKWTFGDHVHSCQEFHKRSRKLYDPSFGRIYVRFIQRCWSTKFVYLRNKMRKQKYYNPYVLEQQAEKQVLNLFFLTYGPVENNSIKNNSIKLCRANWSTQFRVLSSRRLIYENKNQTQKYLIFINNVRTYRLSHNNCQHCHIFTSHPALCHETHMNRKYNSFGMK